MMTRHDLRDAAFRIVFQIPFYPSQDITDQEENYLQQLVAEPEEFLSKASMATVEAVKAEEDKIALADGETDYSEEAISPVTHEDREYIRRKVQGVVLRLPEIDKILEQNSNGWKVPRLGRAELGILRLAIYELKFDEDIPAKVAVDEAVNLAKTYCDDKASGFINGILSSVMKED